MPQPPPTREMITRNVGDRVRQIDSPNSRQPFRRRPVTGADVLTVAVGVRLGVTIVPVLFSQVLGIVLAGDAEGPLAPGGPGQTHGTCRSGAGFAASTGGAESQI